MEDTIARQKRQIQELSAKNAELVRTQKENAMKWTEFQSKLQKIRKENEKCFFDMIESIQRSIPDNGQTKDESVANDDYSQDHTTE